MLLSILLTSLALPRVTPLCFDVNIEYRGGTVLPTSSNQATGWRSVNLSSSLL